MKAPKPVIGLAGGIASGKSAVARIMNDLGAAVIDSDRLNHEILARPDVREQIQTWWGSDTYDEQGRCDRRRLAEVVFRDAAARRQLERLTHPLIDAKRVELMNAHNTDDTITAIVIDAPLLFEAGLDAICDVVVFCDADEADRFARAKATRGWTAEELQRREKSQISLDTKRERSDYHVRNNSDLHALRRHVERIYLTIIQPSSGPSGNRILPLNDDTDSQI